MVYKHTVLGLLQSSRFSFEIPRLLPSILHPAGSTFVELASGACACLFHVIRGEPAKLSAAYGIGKATAELVAGMGKLHVVLPDTNPLYRNIYEAHHKVTRESFFLKINDPAFDVVKASTQYLVEEILRMESLVAKIVCMSPPLPTQQIHAGNPSLIHST